MFDFSKYAINDLLKDYVGKAPIVSETIIDNVHPDYIITIKTETKVIKRVKDKEVPKDKKFAK